VVGEAGRGEALVVRLLGSCPSQMMKLCSMYRGRASSVGLPEWITARVQIATGKWENPLAESEWDNVAEKLPGSTRWDYKRQRQPAHGKRVTRGEQVKKGWLGLGVGFRGEEREERRVLVYNPFECPVKCPCCDAATMDGG
jgi:hypothetical protein